MIAIKITDIKQFMNKFLGSDSFAPFLLQEATITTYSSFYIDGHIHSEFYSQEEWEESDLKEYEYLPWEKIRPVCFDLIKGKHTPVSFQFVLCLKPELRAHILTGSEEGDASIMNTRSFYLNVRYDAQGLLLTTATASASFDPDRTPDKTWDAYLRKFLSIHDFPFEEI